MWRKKHQFQIEDILMQIYGELNRIRLILGEESKTGKRIEDGDKRFGYNPFFEDEKTYEKYRYMKNSSDKFLRKLRGEK